MIAVVTGAGRGIGRAVAVELARRGCDLALLGRTSEPLLETAGRIAALGRRALAVPCDVARSAEVEAASAKVLAEFGVPGIVVSNAGIVRRALIHEMSEDDWDAVIDVNLKGTFLVTRAFLGRMREVGRGRIVVVGSISSTLGTARQSAYCASKWGVVGFVKSLAEELRGTGLQAFTALPGSVDTEMLVGSGFEPKMSPEDVAATVAFLALDAPDAMNGSAIEVFGP